MRLQRKNGFAPAALIHCLLLVGVFGVALLGALRTVSVPREAFIANVIVHDAYYYIVPARNLLTGNGYSSAAAGGVAGIALTRGVRLASFVARLVCFGGPIEAPPDTWV